MTVFATLCLLTAALFAVLWWRGRKHAASLQDRLRRTAAESGAALQEERGHAMMLQRLADAIDDGLYVLDNQQRIVFLNKATQRLFPPVAHAPGRPLLECVHDHRIAGFVAESATTGRRADHEFLITAPLGGHAIEARTYAVTVIPLDNSGLPHHAGGILLVRVQDETEKHMLEKIRKDFVANASHELRTPLSIINGYLENLDDGDLQDPQEIRRACGVMRKHGDRLARIVEDLLVISRMESGEQGTLNIGPFDFPTCAQDVIHRLAPVISAKGAHVSITVLDGADPMLRGDRHYFDQILFNLVANSLKENPARGLEVNITLAQEGGEAVIRVSDNGVGIPQADLPFVFKRFYRVARHHGQEVKGTGLGLSIVKRAVEAHHGSITLRSAPGIETVFTIRIPR